MVAHPGRPSPDSLRNMSPSDIGRRLLPFVQERERAIIPKDFASDLGSSYGPGLAPEMTLLFMEGISWLIRQGLLIEDPAQTVGSSHHVLSRSGVASLSSPRAPASMAADAASRALLHPRIAASALPIFERGSDSYPEAIVSAFMQVETMTRERIRAVRGLPTNQHSRDLFIEALGVPNGVLLPPNVDRGEAVSLRELFGGAFGALRNPHAHGFIRFESDEEVLRILVTASQLVTILERLPAAT